MFKYLKSMWLKSHLIGKVGIVVSVSLAVILFLVALYFFIDLKLYKNILIA